MFWPLTPTSPKELRAIARVHKRQSAQSADRRLARRWPTRPPVHFCHKECDTKMPVDSPPTTQKAAVMQRHVPDHRRAAHPAPPLSESGGLPPSNRLIAKRTVHRGPDSQARRPPPHPLTHPQNGLSRPDPRLPIQMPRTAPGHNGPGALCPWNALTQRPLAPRSTMPLEQRAPRKTCPPKRFTDSLQRGVSTKGSCVCGNQWTKTSIF